MSLPSETSPLAGSLRTMQIIVASLTLGLVLFLGVVFFVIPASAAAGRVGDPAQQPVEIHPPERPPVITYMALALAAASVTASFLVPRLLVKNARRDLVKAKPSVPAADASGLGMSEDAGQLLGIYQIQLIVASALTEGPAFLALIAYMIERSPIALGLAVLLILGVASRFPTPSKVEAWLQDQAGQLEFERQNAPATGPGGL